MPNTLSIYAEPEEIAASIYAEPEEIAAKEPFCALEEFEPVNIISNTITIELSHAIT
jgi:hypothetical protein